ncbi:MAG: SDR family oxidoreductase [Gammaproteobacteria bacterium]
MKRVFQDKTAIVTGAASGIGRELSVQLLQQGARVVATDVNMAGLETLQQEQRAAADRLQIAALDVTDRAACETLIHGVKKQTGQLDFMFNNAGICIFGEVKSMTPDQWDRIIDINIRGVVHGTDIAYRIMCEQGSGHIVNTASGAGLMPIPLMTAYCTTKHAVVGLSTSLREEAKRYNVRVSAICPGIISTNIINATQSHDFDMQKLHAKSPVKELSVERAVAIILKEVAANKSRIVFPRDIRFTTKSYALMPEVYSFLAQFGLGTLLKQK